MYSTLGRRLGIFLKEVPDEEQHKTLEVLVTKYPLILRRGMPHAVVWDKNGILRWKANSYVEKLETAGVIDLARIGHLTVADQCKLARDLGQSLDDYHRASYVVEYYGTLGDKSE